MNQNEPTKLETLNGGTDVPVIFKDGSTRSVLACQLPARKMPDYLRAQDNEAEMIELASKLTPDEVDNLSEASHELLVAEIERINSDFFARWGKRQKVRAETVKANLGVK
jgi:hypothetical protein